MKLAPEQAEALRLELARVVALVLVVAQELVEPRELAEQWDMLQDSHRQTSCRLRSHVPRPRKVGAASMLPEWPETVKYRRLYVEQVKYGVAALTLFTSMLWETSMF